MSKAKGTTPRKFAEKIALLNKKEAEGNAEFERIIKEVEQTTRFPPLPVQQQQAIYYPSRSSSSSSWTEQHSPAGCFEPAHQNQQHHHQQVPHHLLTGPNQAQEASYHVSLATPANVPNINIFPIDDESQHAQNNHHLQQQQQQQYRNLDCSTNQISAARSLPDIANLRVSGSLGTSLGPSYSDCRIGQSSSDGYDNNNYEPEYSPNHLNGAAGQQLQQHLVPVHHQQQLPASQRPWRCVELRQNQIQTDHHNSQAEAAVQQQQPEYCLEAPAELDSRFSQRANSTNATLISWHHNNNNNNNNNNDDEDQQPFNIIRAKSSEVYPYPQANSQLEPDFRLAPSQNNPEQLFGPNYRVRSSSYNSIDHFNNRNPDHPKALQHQPAFQTHQQQQQLGFPPETLEQVGGQQAIYTDDQGYQFYEQ